MLAVLKRLLAVRHLSALARVIAIRFSAIAVVDLPEGALHLAADDHLVSTVPTCTAVARS